LNGSRGKKRTCKDFGEEGKKGARNFWHAKMGGEKSMAMIQEKEEKEK